MNSAFLSAVGALAPFLCLMLALFLLAAGGPLQRANRYLAGFLLFAGLDMFGWAAGLLPTLLREALIFRLPLSYLQAPLLYAYASALCFPGRRVAPHLWMAVAAALISSVSLAPRALNWLAGLAPALSAMSSHDTDLVFNAAALHAQYYIYIMLMLRVLLRYRHAYRSFYSNPDSITFSWLATLVATSVFVHTFLLFKSLAWISNHAATYQALDRIVATFGLLVVCALTLTALLRQHLFLGVTVDAEDAGRCARKAIVASNHEDSAAPRTAPDHTALARVRTYVDREKPFLDPGLTIRSLARRMGMGQRELSQIINQQLGVHFFDFVNRYRIDRAAALLSDPMHQGSTILDIAHQSGFNTKSSFNAAFSKHLGTTPTAHRLRPVTDQVTN